MFRERGGNSDSPDEKQLTTPFFRISLEASAVENMRFRPIILNPLARWCAAVTLVAWMGSQALCQTHCLFDACNDEPDDADCHATAAAAPHHGDDDHGSQLCGHDHGADASCLTLKSALAGNGAATLVASQFPLPHTITPFILTPEATVELTASFSRQARLRAWVFRPEVCLGPAFRSHAPPVSSLI
jgi:hypothetical protein